MRDFKGMKRQRGRNRNGGGGGGGKPQHNSNRAFDSNGPDGMKVRGAAQHVYEKYQQLARDAHTAGDRVTAENFLQHAEHYFRVMRAMQPLRPVSEIIGRDQFASGYDIDFEDESGPPPIAEGEPNGEGERVRDEARAGEPHRDDRFREDRQDRYSADRFQNERPAGERFSSDRRPNDRVPSEPLANDRNNGADRGQRPYRDDRPRFRDDRSSRYTGREVGDPRPPVEPAETVVVPAPEPSERVLRADDGEINHAPAFLQVRPQEPRDDRQPGRPRRRRPPRINEPADEASGPAESDEG